MILLPGAAATLDEAKAMITAARDDGRGLAMFREMVVAQGGDGNQVDDPNRLPFAPIVEPIFASRSGYIASIDTGECGWAAVNLGCGRLVKTDLIDPAAGFILTAKVGQWFDAGQEMGNVQASSEAKAQTGVDEIIGALHWSDEPVDPLPLFYAVVGDEAQSETQA
jgi:pyrimidine-nucleoside phosphorylase